MDFPVWKNFPLSNQISINTYLQQINREYKGNPALPIDQDRRENVKLTSDLVGKSILPEIEPYEILILTSASLVDLEQVKMGTDGLYSPSIFVSGKAISIAPTILVYQSIVFLIRPVHVPYVFIVLLPRSTEHEPLSQILIYLLRKSDEKIMLYTANELESKDLDANYPDLTVIDCSVSDLLSNVGSETFGIGVGCLIDLRLTFYYLGPKELLQKDTPLAVELARVLSIGGTVITGKEYHLVEKKSFKHSSHSFTLPCYDHPESYADAFGPLSRLF
ncbi:hypothetical protein RF11_07320 [Thelohanellus kitauei]|uniref:Uncharacterized protein n=1 Tax=Thelohanellus kitauei TaxID=669202 RepID=A0A0C2JEP2_THEKT|nr:hypothetical protein RF11_07320 [Thelohanellus kitauei]